MGGPCCFDAVQAMNFSSSACRSMLLHHCELPLRTHLVCSLPDLHRPQLTDVIDDHVPQPVAPPQEYGSQGSQARSTLVSLPHKWQVLRNRR